MALGIVTAGFLLLYGTLLFFYFRHWKKTPDYQAAETPTVFLSVVIAARNEEKTLPLLLKDLSAQSHPPHLFEVIVVDDHSTDGTAAVAKAFSRVQTVLSEAPPQASSKKAAIATGVKKAKGELLVVTDADCRVGKEWLRTVASFYQRHRPAFIAAPVRFTHGGSLLQVFQVLDFITLQGITAAGVNAGFHALCNGANLAYTKRAFEDVNGFDGIDRVATGDDLLLMHKIWKRHPQGVRYLKNKEAVVSTEALTTWKAFLSQRRRWASKTLVYDDWRIVAVLGFVLLLNLLPFALCIAAAAGKVHWLTVPLFLVGKTVIEWPFVSSVAAFYGQQKLMRWFFFCQPLHVFYTVFVGLLSQFGKYEWKGRRTR